MAVRKFGQHSASSAQLISNCASPHDRQRERDYSDISNDMTGVEVDARRRRRLLSNLGEQRLKSMVFSFFLRVLLTTCETASGLWTSLLQYSSEDLLNKVPCR